MAAWRQARFVGVALLIAGFATDLRAHENIEEVVVYGRATQQLGSAQSASEGMVGFDDIALPPLLRVGELVEAIPGMVATQHSGTGKANQYFLRGFNLDHGTDFAASLDGVPINLRTHGHGQGYLDLNFLIAELVETMSFVKGSYSARVGDFSTAANAAFSYRDVLEDALAEIELGSYSFRRGIVAGSFTAGEAQAIAALEVQTNNGPWDLDEDLQQIKFYTGWRFPVGDLHARIALHGYDNEWTSTDQIPERAVESGLIDDRGFIDPDLGGDTHRYALTADIDGHSWSAGAYAIDYELALFSNFTYFLDDETNGDEFEQRDRRNQYGAWFEGGRELSNGNRPFMLRYGANWRFDDIDELGLYRTAERARLQTIRDDKVEQHSLSGFLEAESQLTERLRATAGVRVDWYDWDVSARQAANSGSGSDAVFSPKLALAWRVAQNVEGYANWGRGFHSNDVRGATITVDPASGDSADTVDTFARSNGGELGVRFERGTGLNLSVTAFLLDLDSELLFVGDAGTTEVSGASRRTGVEVSGFWQALEWLALNAAYTDTNARFRGVDRDEREIPGAVGRTFSLGANMAWQNGVKAGIRARYLGEAPLIEDDSVRSGDSWLVNAGVGYEWRSFEFHLDVFNLFDSNDTDIAYFFASRLPGEPAGGVEDTHYHPLEPRTARASVRFVW
ncbi:MAG: TonB-dependent receptor [Pseudomonadota bacterium]